MQATRSIPTHSNLKESLEQYFRDSRELSQSLLELTDRSNYLLLGRICKLLKIL